MSNITIDDILERLVIQTGDGLENVVAGLGTERDKAKYSAYGSVTRLEDNYLSQIYQSSWLAKSVVNIPAEDMTREWYSVSIASEMDKNKSKNNQKLVSDYEKRLQLRKKTYEALVWSRLFGGAFLLLGIRGDKDLSKELDINSLSKDSLQYIRVFDKTQLRPDHNLDDNLESDNYGLPISYTLNGSGLKIHNSRLIRFDGELVPFQTWRNQGYWHDSVLQHLYEDLKSYDTMTAAITSMIFEANVDVIKSPGIISKMSTKEGEQLIIKRFILSQLLKSFNRTLLIDTNEEHDKKGNQFGGLSDIWNQYRINSAGAARIPVTRLFGESAKGLNATGDGDLRNYYDDTSNSQEVDLRPRLEKINNLICISIFGSLPDGIELKFNPLWQIEPQDKADIDLKNAQRDQIYLDKSIIPERVVATELMNEGVYSGLTQHDINDLEELMGSIDPQQENQPPNQGNQ